MVEIVEDAFAEMHARYDQIDRGVASEDDFRRILLILDEYYVFVEQVNAWWRLNRPQGDRRSSHPVLDTVGELAAMARGASIHLLLGVQRPDSTHFPAGARDNFRFRVSLAELSPEGNRMMWEREARELPRLPSDVPGRAVISTPRGPRLAQVFWTPNPAKFRDLPEADRAVVQALLPPGATWAGPAHDGVTPTKPGDPARGGGPASKPDPADRLLALLMQALRSRTAHLTAADGGPPADRPGTWGWNLGTDGQPEPGGVWIGCLAPGSTDRLHLMPGAAVEVARQAATALGEPFATARSDIDDALAAADLVATETDGGVVRRTVRRTLPGAGRVRVWDIPAQTLRPAGEEGADGGSGAAGAA
jgi:hypothetical protein